MTYRLNTLLTGGTLFECPRWHEDRWWLSDFKNNTVLSVSTDGVAQTELRVEHEPSGIGWMADGSMLVVSQRDRRVIRKRPDGRVSTHADLSALASGRLNDMVVDRNGRAYVGNFGSDVYAGQNPVAVPLIMVDVDGRAQCSNWCGSQPRTLRPSVQVSACSVCMSSTARPIRSIDRSV